MSWQWFTIGVAVALFLFDFQNVLARSRRRTLGPAADASDDYTIIVPVYGHPRYFADREHLRPYIENVLVACEVSTARMQTFAEALEEEGWRVKRVRVASPSPPSLIRAALPSVNTTISLRMDADTRPVDEIAPFVASMLADGADICSTKVRVFEPDTNVKKMQDLEYGMAMLSRHFRPWLTSGACFAARTESLKTILASHSMWFSGEDIETGRVAFAQRLRIRHLDMIVETDAPGTWPGLFAQRRSWWAGSFRHSVVNADRNAIQLPLWTLYYVALVWVGLAFKWDSLLTVLLDPRALVQTFAALFAVYAVVTVVANWQVRSWRMLLFPPYALAQAMLMPTVGSASYFSMARDHKGLGRYLFGFRRGVRT